MQPCNRHPRTDESRRTGEQVRQQVIATLRRLDELATSGQLERLLRSGARFATQALVLEAAREEPALAVSVRRIGPGLVFELNGCGSRPAAGR